MFSSKQYPTISMNTLELIKRYEEVIGDDIGRSSQNCKIFIGYDEMIDK